VGTSDRRPYLTATTLDQNFLDDCHDNLDSKLEMIADVEGPVSTLRISDRNKYVGSTFYQALTQFPVIERTLGDWLSPTLEFSTLQLFISNVAGRFNNILQGGANYLGWIGKSIEIKMGLRDVSSTYKTLFKGQITDIGGAQRNREGMTLIARDKFDSLNKKFPNAVFTRTTFPYVEEENIGIVIPIIYGDWTVNVDARGASVPAFSINGAHPNVIDGTLAMEMVISDNDNFFFDTAKVYVYRGDTFYLFDVADINIIPGNRAFSIKQDGSGGTTLIDGTPFRYEKGDTFFVQVKGKTLGSYDDNIVSQAKDILETYGGVAGGDFASNWTTYRDKASPAESAISTFKSRVWIQEQQDLVQYVLSLLEQARLEMFIDRSLKLKLFAIHFDEFVASPSFTAKNWDIAAGTLTPSLDDQNIWNRARADYNFDPRLNANSRQTSFYKNALAVTQMGKEISKSAIFPNFYVEADVILNLKEMIKLASSSSELIEMTLTSRAAKLDLGQFIKVNIDLGSIKYEDVPMMIRKIGYDPKGLNVPMKVWSMQMCPFSGYEPGYSGTVGGYSATIDEET